MRPGSRLPAVAVLLVAASLGWSACGGGGGGDITEPEVGTLEVTTATTGPEPDAEGYLVSIDGGAAAALGANASLRRENLATGTHTVALTGVAANCAVAGDAVRSVTIAADAVATAAFAIACTPTTGAIAVTVTTTGPADPDGYAVLIDGQQVGAVGVDGTLTVFEIAPGDHTVALAGVSGTCDVDGESQRPVTVTAGATASVAYAVACAPPPPEAGSLVLSVTTTGSPADPDGYAVIVDGGDARPIAADGDLTIDGVAAGAHSVLLGGVAANCVVGGSNPRDVAVTAGAGTDVAFAVACSPVTGALTVTIAGLPGGTDADVTVTRSGGFRRQLAATATLDDLAPGSYAVAAAEVTSGGTRYVPTPASQNVSVSAGGSAAATVTYAAVATPTLNLRIDGWYLSQGVQTADNGIPLVGNREAYLRVFVLANEANDAAPAVRVHVFRNGSEVRTLDVPAPSGSTPTANDEGRLGSSWNVKIPRDLIGSGFALSAEVDPDDAVAERDEDDNDFPRNGGPRAPEVRTVPLLALRFVPVRLKTSGLTGDVTADNKARFLELTRKIYPLPGADGDLHAVYTTDTDKTLTPDDANGAWATILSELDALRVAEGTSRQYYGVVKLPYFAGLAGLGFLGVPTAMGYDNEADRGRTMAHELGHTWNRRHAPCGGPAGVDPDYPHAGGITGAYGIDLSESELKAPWLPDIMGYCASPWVSDYTYRGVMEFRGSAALAGVRLGAAAERCLIVWGRVVEGRVELEPAFEVVTRASLPARPGAYTLSANGTDGARVLSLSFDPVAVADHPRGTGHFAFAIPVRSIAGGRVASLRVTGPAATGEQSRVVLDAGSAAAISDPVEARRTTGGVRVRWNAASHPLAVVRDAESGQILSLGRGGDVEVPGTATRVEVLLSDRVGSRPVVLPVAP